MNRKEWAINNIELVHSSCCQKRLTDFQETFKQPQWEYMAVTLAEGGTVTVKTEFTDKRGSEHMWVDVDCVDLKAKAVTGCLGNDPSFVDYIGFGDRVIVRFEDISDLNIVRSLPSEVVSADR